MATQYQLPQGPSFGESLIQSFNAAREQKLRQQAQEALTRQREADLGLRAKQLAAEIQGRKDELAQRRSEQVQRITEIEMAHDARLKEIGKSHELDLELEGKRQENALKRSEIEAGYEERIQGMRNRSNERVAGINASQMSTAELQEKQIKQRTEGLKNTFTTITSRRRYRDQLMDILNRPAPLTGGDPNRELKATAAQELELMYMAFPNLRAYAPLQGGNGGNGGNQARPQQGPGLPQGDDNTLNSVFKIKPGQLQ